MKVFNIKIDEVIPYENNPRNNDAAVEYVANSIKNFGFQQPIVVDVNNVVIAGHTRLKAAKRLGLTSVPVVVATGLTEEQVRAYRLADNKAGEIATWDDEALELELDDLTLDMEQFGFIELENVTLEVEEENEPKERKDLSDSAAECFQVIVECADEAEQEEIYNRLQSEGLECRVLTL